MSWEAITALSAAFTGLVILVTAAVAVDQLRQLRAQRRDAAAVELVRALQDVEFTRAFELIYSLPAGISAADLKARGHEYEDAANVLAFRFEMLGVLVYRGTVSFQVTEELAGGAIVGIWQRLEDRVRDVRIKRNYPVFMEWFQWLAEQFVKRDRLQQEPAHSRLRDWSPPAS